MTNEEILFWVVSCPFCPEGILTDDGGFNGYSCPECGHSGFDLQAVKVSDSSFDELETETLIRFCSKLTAKIHNRQKAESDDQE
jgi:hypothetical protein